MFVGENDKLNGKLGGKIMRSGYDYGKINEGIKSLVWQSIVNPSIGEAKEPVPVQIGSMNRHGLKRGITSNEAQGFIDNAVVMFDQGDRFLYVSHDGNVVLLDKERRVVSAYRKEHFDNSVIAILEVVENGRKNN